MRRLPTSPESWSLLTHPPVHSSVIHCRVPPDSSTRRPMKYRCEMFRIRYCNHFVHFVFIRNITRHRLLVDKPTNSRHRNWIEYFDDTIPTRRWDPSDPQACNKVTDGDSDHGSDNEILTFTEHDSKQADRDRNDDSKVHLVCPICQIRPHLHVILGSRRNIMYITN